MLHFRIVLQLALMTRIKTNVTNFVFNFFLVIPAKAGMTVFFSLFFLFLCHSRESGNPVFLFFLFLFLLSFPRKRESSFFSLFFSLFLSFPRRRESILFLFQKIVFAFFRVFRSFFCFRHSSHHRRNYITLVGGCVYFGYG